MNDSELPGTRGQRGRDLDEQSALDRAIRARRMIRSFTDRPLHPEQLDDALDLARRAPSAGNTSAVEFIVLDTPTSVDRYWKTTLTEDKRARFRWAGLLTAPALVILSTRPGAYVERYNEPDKARPGLGQRTEAWAQPFWWIDAGMVAQNLLLIAADRGWGAALFGLFDHERAVRDAFGVPDDRRLVCTIAIGEPGEGDEPGRSASRGRPPIDQIIHRQGFSSDPGHHRSTSNLLGTD